MNIAIRWIIIFFVCLVLQSTVVYAIALWGIKPDLLMVALFLLAVEFGPLAGIFVGFGLGLTLDLYAPTNLGQHALAATVTGCFMGFFNERTIRTDPLMKMAILVIAFFINDLLYLIIQSIKSTEAFGALAPQLLTKTLPRALYSAVVGALYYFWMMNFKPSSRL